MGAAAGKVILCDVITAQTGTRPSGTQVIDFVGFGNATTFEGNGPAPAPSATTSVQRRPEGSDNDQNLTDFVVISPSPTNSGSTSDTTPPDLQRLSPADDSTLVPTNSVLSILFNEPVVAGKGFIKISNDTDTSADVMDVISPNVNISGNRVNIYGINLQPGKNYHVLVADTNFKDLAGNYFAGFDDTTAWNFSTRPEAAETQGALNKLYRLDTLAGIFGSDGFRQYSVSGRLTWASTIFGHNAANPPNSNTPSPYGFQINGYDNAIPSNVLNEDWLILPKFDLTATQYPVLSFWSRTTFNGKPLQLKISTDYPGYNDPNDYTWTDLNGKFPGQTSNVWTQSSGISLQPFKRENVYIAYVYYSTAEEGARWTLDDIQIDDSPSPPPAGIDITATDILFGYTAPGSSLSKTFVITGNNITADMLLTASANFTLSADSVTFSPSLQLTQSSSNNTARTVYVRFNPTEPNQVYTGAITIQSNGTQEVKVNLTGTTVDPVNTLEVVNWNIEWFGKTGSGFGPSNEALQQQNVKTILQDIGADIYGLVEVVDTARLGSVVREMPGYNYVFGNYGSRTNPPDPAGDPVSEAQKLAFIYKSSVFSNVSARPLINNQDITSISYNNWASGRYPFMLTADVTIENVTKTIRFVLLHAKANTSPTLTSYNRRKNGADELHSLLNDSFPNDNIVLLGDMNDDLDSTITDGINPRITSYVSFMNDASNFFPVTLALSNAGKASTVAYKDMIDHVIVSNEMQRYYMTNSASVLSDVAALVPNYATTTTDHYPVFTRFRFFENSALPFKLGDFTAHKEVHGIKLSWKTYQETNTREFIIEKSVNGTIFSVIGSVPAAGTTTAEKSYFFKDNNPANGYNYYRLKLVDKDESFVGSAIVKVVGGRSIALNISPNPAKEFFTVAFSNMGQQVTIQLVNLSGQVIKQQYVSNTGTQKVLFSLSGVPKGIYWVKFKGHAEVLPEKVVVE